MSVKLDEIGYWSELKLEIIQKYAAAYSRILNGQVRLKHIYIDAFCGAGIHKSRASGNLVHGSPTVALGIDPPFCEYHFIDLNRRKIGVLKSLIEEDSRCTYDPEKVFLYNKDCNDVLITDVFPRARYEDYHRALCLLDPYGLHLDWKVIYIAGQMKSIDLFLNFPIGDMNRNVLLRDQTKTNPDQLNRMTKYWGDESWRQSAYSSEGDLFGYKEKLTNRAVVKDFKRRLQIVAGFSYVPEPMPMRNSRGVEIYYLFFASQNKTGLKIVKDIFNKYRDRRS